MAFLKIAFLFSVCVFLIHAESVSFDEEVDLTAHIDPAVYESINTKPDWAASCLNLILPGTGNFYLGEKRSAAAYLTVDILLLGGFFYTHFTTKRLYTDSRAYARTHAGTKSQRLLFDPYWRNIGNESFMNAYDYNKALDNNRLFEDKYIDDLDQWSWDGEHSRDTYAEMRRRAGYWQTSSMLVLGSLVLNRLVSFVDARIMTKRYNDQLYISAGRFEPSYCAETKTHGLAFNFTLHSRSTTRYE